MLKARTLANVLTVNGLVGLHRKLVDVSRNVFLMACRFSHDAAKCCQCLHGVQAQGRSVNKTKTYYRQKSLLSNSCVEIGVESCRAS